MRSTCWSSDLHGLIIALVWTFAWCIAQEVSDLKNILHSFCGSDIWMLVAGTFGFKSLMKPQSSAGWNCNNLKASLGKDPLPSSLIRLWFSLLKTVGPKASVSQNYWLETFLCSSSVDFLIGQITVWHLACSIREEMIRKKSWKWHPFTFAVFYSLEIRIP